jgi:hypothetical protein
VPCQHYIPIWEYVKEPQADIQADEAGKVGGADIKIGGDDGPGGPDIKTNR